MYAFIHILLLFAAWYVWYADRDASEPCQVHLSISRLVGGILATDLARATSRLSNHKKVQSVQRINIIATKNIGICHDYCFEKKN